MTTARDIMTPGAICVGANETVTAAAKKFADLSVGAMPICGVDNKLKGMLTDRDIVVKVLAEGRDPGTVKAGELGEGKPVTIGADDDASEILRTMREYQIRRLPVIDGKDLVGIVALADVARAMPDTSVGEALRAISEE